MNRLSLLLVPLLFPLLSDAKVMNPGEAKGQLVYLSAEDVLTNSPRFRGLNPLSIPVFAELPTELAVVAGAVTLQQQNLLSHVQIKSRARKTPNLDLSDVPGGLESELMRGFRDGDYAHLVLGADGSARLDRSTREEAIDFYERRSIPPVRLEADLGEARIRGEDAMSWRDHVSVGSKAANYAELARTLNSAERKVVRPSLAIPFRYYHAYVTENVAIARAIEGVLRDPLMRKVSDVGYRERKLEALRDLMTKPEHAIDARFLAELVGKLDGFARKEGGKAKMKFRSSTNSEDLPNFNGAGLYESEGYDPRKKDGTERTRDERIAEAAETLRKVWASVWTLRAWEERTAFGIPHADVRMGIQINPSYTSELADGVVVTRNVAERDDLPGEGVFVECQRGSKYSVANPAPGVRPEQILVRYDPALPLDPSGYRVDRLQRSNVADDGTTILPHDNPKPVLTDAHAIDLALQSMRATVRFRGIFARPGMALDLEFKLDRTDTGTDRIYLKQARPYVE